MAKLMKGKTVKIQRMGQTLTVKISGQEGSRMTGRVKKVIGDSKPYRVNQVVLVFAHEV